MIFIKPYYLSRIAVALLLTMLTVITGCTTTKSTTVPLQSNVLNPMPGDAEFYGFGVLQSKDDFANVEVAQLNLGMYRTRRSWEAILPNKGSARYVALRTYFPVDVRWKLKDGREFMLENIDTAAIMREYFKTNNFLLHHQRLGRPRYDRGDYDPDLQFGVKDDTVVIKWGLILNHTPPNERFQPSGAVNPWKTEHEEHFVTALKGKPTSGIDFSKTQEFLK